MKIDSTNPTQSCLLRLQSVIDTLKPAEHRIAEYILNNPQDVLSSTLNELTEKSQCSYATINRLITRIGYNGFKEMKKFLYQDTLKDNSLDFLDVVSFSQKTSCAEISQNIYTISSRSLIESCNLIHIETIDAAVDKILSAKSICIVGNGSSGICARYAYSRFFRIGIPCVYDADSTLDNMHVSLLSKGDLLFAISSSGRTKNVLTCAKRAKEKGATVISLCDYAVSPLSKVSDISLFTTSRNVDLFMHIDMPLLTGQFYLLDVLFMCCCAKMGHKASDLYVKTKDSADAEKMK